MPQENWLGITRGTVDVLNPLTAGNWNYDAAAHLALRASFGEPPAELEKWVSQGLDSTLEHLLYTPPPAATAPDWAYPTRDEDLLPRIRNAETTVVCQSAKFSPQMIAATRSALFRNYVNASFRPIQNGSSWRNSFRSLTRSRTHWMITRFVIWQFS